ncbi:hypothetical protein NFI96_006918 [Prochilodus magdalenae]|nr:hypothetical protein NFI96_006918 [Prochilodus magdalenae]
MEAEGKLKLAIQSLSFLKIGQAGFDNSGQVDGGDKQNFEKVSCTFHGDFKLYSNPCTFQDALEVYKQLPHLLGNNGEHAVPLQVWLYPLSKLPKAGAEVPVCNVSPISDGLNTSLEHAMDRLNTTEGKIDDLMDYEAAKSFPPFQSKLQDLRQQFSQHKARFMTSLADLLPLIRGKEKEESVLLDLLKAHEKSLFNSAAMDQWLKYRKMESEVLGSILDQLREIEVSLDDDLHLLLMESETERVVSFTFAFLDTPDPFLLDLAEQREANTAEVRTWLTGEVITAMRKNLKLFRDLKKSNNSSSTKFSSSSRMSLIFSHRGATEGPSHEETQPGASIVLYEVCSDDPVCFTPPSKPTLSVTRRNSNSITLELNCECEATEARILEYRPRKAEEWETIEIRKDTVTLTKLEHGTEYEIRCTAMGENKYLPVISDIIKVRTSDAS